MKPPHGRMMIQNSMAGNNHMEQITVSMTSKSKQEHNSGDRGGGGWLAAMISQKDSVT